MEQKTKQCKICQEIKSIDNYSKKQNGKYNKCSWCKSCVSKYYKEYMSTHPQKRIEKNINDLKMWHNKYKLEIKK